MSGPAFLALYALLAAMAIAWCRWFARRQPSAETAVPMVPSRIDPYAIAWLRGGVNEVIRLAVFDLARRGLLVPHVEAPRPWWHGRPEPRLVADGASISPSPLPPMAAEVLAFHRQARKAGELFKPPLVDAAIALCRDDATRAEDDGLVLTRERRRAIWSVILRVLAGLMLLSVARMVTSVGHGHGNIILLIVLTVIAATTMLIMCPPPRPTATARRYLKDLRDAYLSHAVIPARTADQARDANLMLAVALVGFSALHAVPEYAYLHVMFARSAADPAQGGCGSGGGGCGHGGGSSGCGSGGGGGGCGGGGD